MIEWLSHSDEIRCTVFYFTKIARCNFFLSYITSCNNSKIDKNGWIVKNFAFSFASSFNERIIKRETNRRNTRDSLRDEINAEKEPYQLTVH